MTSRLGIALGAAALAGLAGASLASWQNGPPTAVRLIVPAGALGGNLLGSPGLNAPVPGLAPGWLLLRTLPDHTPAAGPAAAAVAGAAPAPAVEPAPVRSQAPVQAVQATMPIRLPVQTLPMLPRLPLVTLPLAASPHLPPVKAPKLPGAGHRSGSGTGHGQSHSGHGNGSPSSPSSPSSQA